MNTPGSIFFLSLLFIPANSVDMSTGTCKSEDDNSCKDPSAFHGEADEETNLLQTAVQINTHQETLVSKEEALASLVQQTLSGSISPETSLIQAVKLDAGWVGMTREDFAHFDWGEYVKSKTVEIISQPGPNPPAQCPTEKTKNLTNAYGTDACCNIWRRAGHCKGPYENWMTANCAEACCDKTPTSPGTTLIGEPGTSCDETCAVVSMACDNARLQSVDTEEEVIQVAGEAVVSCNGTDSSSYEHSPSHCTSSWCKGTCSYGPIPERQSSWRKRGDCSYKGYSWDKWSRFCPCRDLSAAEKEAAAAYAASRAPMATILGEPDKTCDETCSTLKILMNGTVTTTCKCRDDHACTSDGHHTSWCYIDSMDSCSDSVKGGGGPWSEESCSNTLGGVCDDVRLQAVDSPAEVLQLAGEAGISCTEAEDLSYAYSPSQCTGKYCCGDGSCTGMCTYGKNTYSEARKCSAKAGFGHQRLCPCMKPVSLLSVSAKSKKDKKGTQGKK